MQNFTGTSFIVHVDLYICSGKEQIREGFFLYGRGTAVKGLLLEQKVEMKDLRLELLLEYELTEKLALMLEYGEVLVVG